MAHRPYTVRALLEEHTSLFEFTVATGDAGLDREIKEPLVHRLSLAVVGHYTHFPAVRLQVCGFTEHSFLEKLDGGERRARIDGILDTYGQWIPAIVFTHGLPPFPELVEKARERGVAVLATPDETVLFINELSAILEDRLASSNTLQGVMVSIHGVGIIITGESGVGKSEAAIELLKRGHLFVADDVVRVYPSTSGGLMGTAEQVIRNFIEVRGLGIVDIQSIFGVGALLERSRVELIINLKAYSPEAEYDRLGSAHQHQEVLGVKVPRIVLPVGPGRNLATLIEIAALNFRLQQRGYNAAEELDRRVLKLMQDKHEG